MPPPQFRDIPGAQRCQQLLGVDAIGLEGLLRRLVDSAPGWSPWLDSADVAAAAGWGADARKFTLALLRSGIVQERARGGYEPGVNFEAIAGWIGEVRGKRSASAARYRAERRARRQQEAL